MFLSPLLFLERYNTLYDFWLADIWRAVPADLMRRRPHERVNSIAWNLWHLTRGEDAALNRFVADRPQALDEGGWLPKLNLPWRDHGGGMTFAEVDELSRRIDISALHGYSDAVHARSQEIIQQIDKIDLDFALPQEHIRRVLVDEGLAHTGAEELVRHYSGWSRGKWLLNLGLTHLYQHIGEIGVIAGLLGVNFD